MASIELIECLYDSVNISEHILRSETEKAIESNRIYKENFVAKKKNGRQFHNSIFEYCEVEKNTTFNAAKKYLQYGKTAVLNFANPHNPGGGVYNGAMAQEECLCRSSNLYPCISNKNVFYDYYLYHKNMEHYFFSDRLIYTKGVTVFKDDSDVPQLMPENEWFQVDVITCAAPYLAKRKYINKKALKELFKGRIKNIFEAAIDNDVEVIILGAFGCGAFKNPPQIVARAFREVIEENNYDNYFKKIVFAIKSNSLHNSNLGVFDKVLFDGYVQVTLSQSDIPPAPLIEPLRSRCDEYNIFKDYIEWKNYNKYNGNQFSILGDSISTLNGYNPKGYAVFYGEETCERSGVKEMKDTWWGKMIDFFGGELLVNNSWSGSRVTGLPNSDSLFPSGCSDERTSTLHINGIKPDVIIVYLGTNDWAFGVELGGTRLLSDESNMQYFSSAYETMLSKIKKNYPDAEIWCCTLSTTFMSSNPDFQFPLLSVSEHIRAYNQIIKTTADMNNCKIIDLYSYHIPYDSIDGSHPNANGMNTLATLMIRETCGEEANKFLDCENERHKYSFRVYNYDQNYHVGYRVCENCGKIKYDEEKFSLQKKTDEQQIHAPQGINSVEKAHQTAMTNIEENVIPDDISVGSVIDGRYELLKQIGQNGITKVYLAVDKRINIPRAVRIIQPVNNNLEFVRETILKEVEMVSSFRHPGIPAIVDVILNSQCIFVVMEYTDGISLGDIVWKYGAQPLEQVLNWARQICVILTYLHSLNPPYIHKDIKPDNFILDPNGTVKLIEFDLMHHTYNPNQQEDTCYLGTRGYAAPEQYGGRGQTDCRTDIYGLGQTMYYLLTGIEPSLYLTELICRINPSLPKGLEYIVNKCIQMNPQDRYQTCKDLLFDLDNYMNLPKPKPKGFLRKLLKK